MLLLRLDLELPETECFFDKPLLYTAMLCLRPAKGPSVVNSRLGVTV